MCVIVSTSTSSRLSYCSAATVAVNVTPGLSHTTDCGVTAATTSPSPPPKPPEQADSVLYTASGDQHVGVWDTAVGRVRTYCAGHDGSVKVVAPHASQQDVFASGG